jgi:hypothetical protein
MAGGGDPEQAETEQAAELAHPRIPFPARASQRRSHRQPDLLACGAAIDALEDEFEVEAELQLADHDETVAA